MERTIRIEDPEVFDPDRVPKELWNLILHQLSAERRYYPTINEIEFILPFLKLVCKRFYQAAKDYAITHKIKEKNNNRRIATMPMLAEWGALSCIKLMRDYGIKFSEGTCEMAARGGHLDVLKYARENGCVWNVSTMYKSMCVNAILGGKLEVLQYLREENCPFESNICDKTAEYGRLDMYKYLKSIGYGIDLRILGRELVKRGYIEFLKYITEVEQLITIKTDCTSYILYDDCHVDCLKYLHQLGHSLNSMTWYFAAQSGNLATLKYAHENGVPWTADTVKISASNGQYSCMVYAMENGCPWPEDLCNIIVGGSNWNIPIMTRARRVGSVECLKYAHEHGAKLTSTVAKLAAQCEQPDCLIYLHEHGAPWDESVYLEALTHNRMQNIKYAREHGCPWSAAVFVRTFVHGTDEQLQYLAQEGCPFDNSLLIEELKKYGASIRIRRKELQDKIKLLKKLGIEINIDLKALLDALIVPDAAPLNFDFNM